MAETETLPNITSTAKPEYVAGLTMDIELGQHLKPGEVIEFDFDAFYKTAKDMGATDEQITDLHLDIIDPQYRPKGNRGSFGWVEDPESGETIPLTEIVIDTKEPEDMNRTLVHETQHYVDDANGEELGSSSRAYKDGIEATRKAKKAITAMGLGVIGLLGTHKAGLEAAAIPNVAMLAWGWSKIMIAHGYISHPSEIKARDAEKKFGNTKIISITS